MKKIINIFLCLLSIFSFFICYNYFNVKENNFISNIEKDIGEGFEIPYDSVLSDPNGVYSILLNASNKLNGNIFRQIVTTNKNGDLEIQKYILIKNDTKFFSKLNLDKNNEIKNLEENEFISSEFCNNENQVSTAKLFSNNLYIGHLKKSFEHTSAPGTYFVELNGVSYNEFLEVLASEVNEKYAHLLKEKYKASDFETDLRNTTSTKDINKELYLYSLSLLIATTILMCYYVLNNSKKISILKLFGFSNTKIWLNVFQKNITNIFSLMTLFFCIILLFINFNIKFILYVILYQLIYYIIITITSLIPLVLLLKTNISINIKNKDNKNVLFFINIFTKILISSITILVFVFLFDNFKLLNRETNNLNDWKKGNTYGVFYPIYLGDDKTEKNMINTYMDTVKLYKEILNKNGALYINAKQYEEAYEYLNKDSLEKEEPYERSLIINPNYLKVFKIKDDKDNTINISENEKDLILLVPEIYKGHEEKIKKVYKDLQYYYTESWIKNETALKRNVDFVKNQKIKIIWTRKDQDIFSFNPEVNKKENGYIRNPVITVFTENNSLDINLWGINGGGGTDAMKISLVNNNLKSTYDDLKPYLIKYNLQDNLRYLIKSNEKEEWKIYNLDEEIKTLSILFIISFSFYFIILFQNSIIVFNKYKKQIVIRRTLGLGFLKSYKEFWIIYMINCILMTIVSGIFRNYFFTINNNFFETIILISFLDFIYSFISIIKIEKKNKIEVLKGE
ncbi:MAG: hypothetical protein RSB77_03630 [Bacilli bacterium]